MAKIKVREADRLCQQIRNRAVSAFGTTTTRTLRTTTSTTTHSGPHGINSEKPFIWKDRGDIIIRYPKTGTDVSLIKLLAKLQILINLHEENVTIHEIAEELARKEKKEG